MLWCAFIIKITIVNNMKNFDQFLPETQNAIKAFKNNFWQTLKKYHKFMSSNIEMTLSESHGFTSGIIESFFIFNGGSEKEFEDFIKFMKSKNYYR